MRRRVSLWAAAGLLVPLGLILILVTEGAAVAQVLLAVGALAGAVAVLLMVRDYSRWHEPGPDPLEVQRADWESRGRPPGPGPGI